MVASLEFAFVYILMFRDLIMMAIGVAIPRQLETLGRRKTAFFSNNIARFIVNNKRRIGFISFEVVHREQDCRSRLYSITQYIQTLSTY